METHQPLNLTRRLRPKNFDEIIGQSFSVKMLQNGLYLNKFFPVYLFAGQRGCGKTTTARVFAAAINCENLPAFQTAPDKNPVPCLACSSCLAMQTGQHPDFIEIDAASHTGVDNVRQILESCSYMPLIGRKKIYLIDEAHMLSKAAFNAFLKVLEEPPMTALFMLATTESNKIPITVKSRCFQAFFKALPHQDLKAYLISVCQSEGITISNEAIDIILQETEGSARDALNLLEQVRSIDQTIDESSMHKALGIVSKKDFLTVVAAVINQKPGALLIALEDINFTTTSPQIIWNMLLELIRALIRIKYNAPLSQSLFAAEQEILIGLGKQCTPYRLHSMLQLLWSQEELFLKTHQKHLLLEHILLQLCEQTDNAPLKPKSTATPQAATEQQQNRPTETPIQTYRQIIPSAPEARPQSSQPFIPKPFVAAPEVKAPQDLVWLGFIEKVSGLGDQMLASIFKQTLKQGFSPDGKIVNLALNNGNQFFKDKVTDTQGLWLPLLKTVYPGIESFHIENISTGSPKSPGNSFMSRNVSLQSPPGRTITQTKDGVDISNTELWPQTNLLIQQFPGTLEKVKDPK